MIRPVYSLLDMFQQLGIPSFVELILDQEIQVMDGKDKFRSPVERLVPGNRCGGMPDIEVAGVEFEYFIKLSLLDIVYPIAKHAEFFLGQVIMHRDIVGGKLQETQSQLIAIRIQTVERVFAQSMQVE